MTEIVPPEELWDWHDASSDMTGKPEAEGPMSSAGEEPISTPPIQMSWEEWAGFQARLEELEAKVGALEKSLPAYYTKHHPPGPPAPPTPSSGEEQTESSPPEDPFYDRPYQPLKPIQVGGRLSLSAVVATLWLILAELIASRAATPPAFGLDKELLKEFGLDELLDSEPCDDERSGT
jgi:hypothetical protein